MGTGLGTCSIAGSIRRLTAATAAMSMALLLGACSQNNSLDLGLASDRPQTANIATASAGNASRAELEKATIYWGEQHAKNPRDAKAAVSYARNLKAMGRKSNALSVLQSAYVVASDDKELLSEYGRLALELGQVTTAEKLLIRAEDPAKPDWRIVSARGTVLAKQGRFKESIAYFEKALALSPGQPSLLNNLAMAYAMDGQASRGEALLRQATESGADDPRLQKNLELVMGLQGKTGEAPAATATAAAQPEAPAPTPRAAVQNAANAAWNRPLPIERETAPVKVAARTASTPLSEDDIVRQAMSAEQVKNQRR